MPPRHPLAWVDRCLAGHPEAAVWIEKILALRLCFAALHEGRLAPSKVIEPQQLAATAVAAKPSPGLPEPEAPTAAHAPMRREMALAAQSSGGDTPPLSRDILRGLWTAKSGGQPPSDAQLDAAHAYLREEAAAVAYVLLHLMFHSAPSASAVVYAVPAAIERYLATAEAILRSDAGLLRPPRAGGAKAPGIPRADWRELYALQRGLFAAPLDAPPGSRRSHVWASTAGVVHPLLAAYLGDLSLLRAVKEDCVKASVDAAQVIAAEALETVLMKKRLGCVW